MTEDGHVAECTVAMLVSNRRRILGKSLDAVYHQSYDRRQVRIIFAENSSDGSMDMLREFQSRHHHEYADIEILERVEGIPQARNRCLGRATGEFIVFVDDDVVAPPETVKAIATYLQENPECALVGVRYVPPSGNSILETIPLVWRSGVLPGMGCTGLRTGLPDAIGEFDEELPWGEDLDFTCRTKKSGKGVALLRKPRAIHLNDQLAFGSNSRPLSDYLKTALEPKTFDASLLRRHKAHFLPLILRKYGPWLAFVAGLALIPLTWIPSALMVLACWLGLQTAYTGRQRLYMPFVSLLSGIASLIGLIRGLLVSSTRLRPSLRPAQ